MSETPDDPLAPRRAALSVLQAALARRAGLEAALAGPAMSALAPRDRAFARALAMATLRRLGQIDRLLAARLTREPPQPARDLLRLGVAQLFWLDTPAFAAVDTSVRLAPKPLRGLVNGVLRRLGREGPPADDPEALAPDWLLARWRAAYGAEAASGIAAVIAQEPAMQLTAKSAELAERACEALPATRLPGGTLATERGGDVATWPGYAEGWWWVQDAAAALPARLLAPHPGETALDLCAAPGGKTFQLAGAGAAVVALDRSAQRLARVRASLQRLGLDAETHAVDAAAWADGRTFDAVLLDAPCSATGTFRRHPDVLWNARPSDIAPLAAAQARLLDAAAARTKPAGRLVYSVCSLEPEEGEAQVGPFLERHGDFALDPIQPSEAGPAVDSVTSAGTLRILPNLDRDGFFIARFKRA